MIEHLKSTLWQSLLVVGFFFFILGLQSLGRKLFFSDRNQPALALKGGGSSGDEGISLLAGAFAFCLLANVLMLIPSLLELCFGMRAFRALSLHSILIVFLEVIVVLIACGGSRFLLSALASPRLDGTWSRLVRPLVGWPAPSRLTIWVTLSVLSVYLTTSQYLSQINYDTALYHLPAVSHLLRLGPELGLANLHFSLGFYSLPYFGQAVLQGFSPSRLILMPSFNIVFLVALVLTCASGLNDDWVGDSRQRSPVLVRKLLFIASILLFGRLDLGSLSSYNADFALACATLALIYRTVFPKGNQSGRLVLALSLLLPVIKLSGLLGLLWILVYRLLCLVLNADPRQLRAGIMKRNPISVLAPRLVALLPLVAVVAIAYGIVGITYAVLSGYLVFPESATGPIFSHAVPRVQVDYVKGAFVSFYARASDSGEVAAVAYAEKWALGQWLSVFLRSERGLLMLVWFALASMQTMLAIVMFVIVRRRYPREHLAFAVAIVAVAGLALFVLPPNPRFFPWLGAMLAYGYGESLLLFPYATAIALLIMMNTISLRLQRPILKSVNDVHVREISIPLEAIKRWRPRSVVRTKDGDRVIVRKPEADKCWAVQRPCTPYFWFLKPR